MTDKQTPREIIEKLAAMTDAEFSQFMARHFEQLCKRQVTRPQRTDERSDPDVIREGKAKWPY